MNDFITEALNNMYLKLGSEELMVNNQIAALVERLDEIKRKRAAFEIVSLEFEDETSESDFDDFDPLLEGEAKPEQRLEYALVAIAEENGGVFNSYDHKERLINMGLLRGEPQTIAQKLYQTLNTSEYFEKNGEKGRWSLIKTPFEIDVSC